jgi:hypothetical protein
MLGEPCLGFLSIVTPPPGERRVDRLGDGAITPMRMIWRPAPRLLSLPAALVREQDLPRRSWAGPIRSSRTSSAWRRPPVLAKMRFSPKFSELAGSTGRQRTFAVLHVRWDRPADYRWREDNPMEDNARARSFGKKSSERKQSLHGHHANDA